MTNEQVVQVLTQLINLAAKGRYDVDLAGAQQITQVLANAGEALKALNEGDEDGITE